MHDAITIRDGAQSMKKANQMIRFVVSNRDDTETESVILLPERGVQTANIGIWLGTAALLWSLLVIPALMI